MSRISLNRRQLLKLIGAAGLSSAFAGAGWPVLAGGGKARVVVVGGGFGGATAAKYLKRHAPDLEVTLIEPQERFYTCPFTNLYLGGLREFESLGHDYRELRGRYGVEVVHALAEDVDVERRRLRLQGGETISWDRLILSPGIDIRWGVLEGYDEQAAERAPHAWKAGPQTRLLRRQLEAMPDGGTFILVAPENPFRCPPGPYERVSMIANYLKRNKPRSKILLLDAKDNFSKQGVFMEGWRENYGDMIEWVGRSDDGRVIRVDPQRLEVETEFGQIHQAAVLNVVPPQKAGFIAERAGVTDATGWVPIEARSFASTQVPAVYVIGDVAEAAPMPKSGFVANSQAKITARAVLADLAGAEPPEPSWTNTCYSVIAPGWGISVANVFEIHEGHLREVPGSGGVSPLGAPADYRAREAHYAEAWYAAIGQDTWGTQPGAGVTR
jgi:sulfide dehydrogenase [flavocytochrome c] flavoprotein chain